MSEMWNSRRGVCFAAGVIVLATVAAYCNSFTVPFLFDDIPSTVENPTIRRLWPIGPILLPPGHYAAVQRRPMINASLAINYAISGEKSWSYHAFNLAAHALAALVLFGIVRRTLLLPGGRERFGRAATPLAAAVALLWAVHPLLTDAVTYIIQRTEVFCGLFYLLTLYCTIRGNSARHPARWYVAAVAACLLAVGSKETALSAPLVVLLYDRVFLSPSWREAFRRRGPLYFGLAVSWLIVLAMLPYGGEGSKVFGEHGAIIEYPLAQPGVIAHYLGLCFWPHPLVLDYGIYTPETAWQIIPFAVLIGVLFVAAIDAFRYRPWLGFLGLCFFAILAHQLELHSFAPAGRRREADVPAAGSGGDGSRGGRISGRAVAGPPGPRVAAGAVHRRHVFDCGRRARPRASHRPSQCRLSQRTFDLAGYNGQDAQERPGPRTISVWPWPRRTFRRSRGRVPESDRTAAQLLGGVQRHRQRARAPRSAWQGRGLLRGGAETGAAVRIGPQQPGQRSVARGRIDEAIAHFKKALAARPEHETTYNNLGSALAGRGQVDDAIVFFQKAVDLRPNFADAHNNLGRALASRGRIDEAIVHFQAGVELKPHDAAMRKSRPGVGTTGS